MKKELSALFVYACLDNYAKKNGKLGFVITQSVFKGGANEGFRQFKIGDGRFFRVTSVADFRYLRPFENATNRTATMVPENSK